MSKSARIAAAGMLAVLLVGSVGGCACRGGYVGPYGGIHPARCWVW